MSLIGLLLALAAILGWFIPWYLRRYSGLDWPVADPAKTLSLGFVTAMLLVAWDWVETSSRAFKEPHNAL